MQYIKNESKRFQTYVANRVVEIREVTTPDQWRHCPGRINPADDASRGLKPQKLSTQHCWWRGPEFLWEPEDCWPNAVVEEVPENDPEVRASTNVHQSSVKQNDRDVNSTTNTNSDDTLPNEGRGLKDLVENCSSWSTLQRRVAWIVRFCHWIMSKRAAHVTGSLTLGELNQATHAIFRSVHNEYFAEDVKELKKNKEVKKSSKLDNLRPELLGGALRVGGRLQEAAALSWDEKHPTILPKGHHVSQ